MKTTTKLLLLVALFSMASCADPDNMLTVIHPDGSCDRAFTAYADSAFMTGSITGEANPFPVEIDDSYSIFWSYKNGKMNSNFPLSKATYDSIITSGNKNYQNGEKDFIVTIGSEYKSVYDMAEKFKLKDSHYWSNMHVRYYFDKKFRFFYSYFTYKETYQKIETRFEVPIETYLNPDEAGFWFTGSPNLAEGLNGIEIREMTGNLEEKYNKWFSHNLWNQQYKIVVNNYDRLDYKPVSKDLLIRLRDSIFKINSKYAPNVNMEECLNSYFQTDAFSQLWEIADSPLKNFEEEFEKQDFVKYSHNSFTYKLVMPGKIMHTNGVNKNDTLHWNLTAPRMFYDNYIIEAQSRKANIWMFILAGVFIATAIITTYIYCKRK